MFFDALAARDVDPRNRTAVEKLRDEADGPN
jgi:hypothetical protein